MIITTSWDDGHPLDLKLADLLDKYGINGTFYVPCKNSEHHVMNDIELRELSHKFEIGGHTVNHLSLIKLTNKEAKYEIENCKLILQDKLSCTINSFCFPRGKFSNRDINLVKNAGFLFGRTTGLFNLAIDINRPIMNTSVHIYNHQYQTLIKHCIKRSRFAPILSYNSFYPYHKSFKKLAKAVLRETKNINGVFHIWGHSWEIEENGLWYDLEETFKILKNENDAIFLNNSETWNHIQNITK